jgi:squalene-hopene/tetraprenyl-beta-curcumene cyclase
MSRTHSYRLEAVVALMVVAIASPRAHGADANAAWSPKATSQYLDSRTAWWLDWSAANRGQGTTCSSCHTTVPYALALPAIQRTAGGAAVPDVAQRLLAGVRKRVEKWDELAAGGRNKGDDTLTPISGGTKRDSALDTESVLNAVVLVANEPQGETQLSDTAAKSLDVMWSRQQPTGAWRWLEFGLQPWDQDGDYFGATLAAVAVNTAGTRYQNADFAPKMTALRGFLKSRLAEKPLLHNRALALWAASHCQGLLSDREKKSFVADLFAVQGSDGGWSMRDLGKANAQSESPGWSIVASYPRGAVSDGYATGLVVFALKRAGVQGTNDRLQKGINWLTTHQAADGTWPTVWVNKERNPQSNFGKFNRDAGAAFALLALLDTK